MLPPFEPQEETTWTPFLAHFVREQMQMPVRSCQALREKRVKSLCPLVDFHAHPKGSVKREMTLGGCGFQEHFKQTIQMLNCFLAVGGCFMLWPHVQGL